MKLYSVDLNSSLKMKVKVSELESLNCKLSEQLDEAGKRSMMIELMTNRVLEESKQYTEQKMQLEQLQEDLSSALDLIQQLFSSIVGYDLLSEDKCSLQQAPGENKFSENHVIMCATACERAADLHQRLHEVRHSREGTKWLSPSTLCRSPTQVSMKSLLSRVRTFDTFDI